MKKSIRILSILMAFAMLIGSFSVMGSAYQAYKGTAIAGQYNDVDTPAFTIDQYASMGLDELDRLLAKEQIKLDLLGMLSLDLTSVDATIGSVLSFLETGSALISMLGDASTLDAICTPLKADTARRSGGDDLKVVYALLDFVSNLKGIAHNYVNGTVSVGILDGFIADYKFDVRELAIGLLYGMTEEGKADEFDYMEQGGEGIPEKYAPYTGELDENGNKIITDSAAINLLQTLLNGLVLGEWKQLDEYFDYKYSVVMPESYAFVDASGNDVSNEAINTATYDYYGWVHGDDWVTVGLGDAIRVAKGAAAPAASYSVIDITGNRVAYDFIEDLMQRAYNYIAVPVLNRDTRGAVLELCGYTIDESLANKTIWADTGEVDENGDAIWGSVENPTYDPNYLATAPASSDGYTEYAKLFNHEAIAAGDAVVPKVTVPANTTFVDYFNTILGEFVTIFATNNYKIGDVTYSWTWNYDEGNDALFDNIVSLGKYLVIVTGDLFFEEDANIPGPDEINGYSGQQILALVMREILNNSVDYIYVNDTHQTMVDVAYAAVEQLAWQDIPQYTYTKPTLAECGNDAETYYAAVVDKMLDILFDIAVYNLNQSFDMVLTDGTDPDDNKKSGLLQYQGDEGNYENNLVQVASWALRTYGEILALDFRCDVDTEAEVANLTADDVWMDIDTIIDAIIPIKGGEGNSPWISAKIAGDGETLVAKTFIFDYILKPVYTLEAANLAEIFARNESGAFATMNGVQVIVDILDNVFDLLFPNVFQPQATLDRVLENGLLADMVYDLIGSLCSGSFTNAAGATMDGRGDSIAAVALPVVCMILGLSDDQEFEEMEIYLPGLISTTGALPSFEIYNGSSGINTAYTDASGKTTQDQLYTYQIETVDIYTYNASGANISTLNFNGVSKGTTIAGGDSVTVNLTGTLTEANIGNLVEFVVTYVVMGEDGLPMTEEATGSTEEGDKVVLSKTVYAYIGETDQDDDAIELVKSVDGRDIKYEGAIYLESGDGLDDITSNIIRIQDKESNTPVTATIESVTNKDTAYPFAAKETVADEISATLEGTKGIYFLYPFEVAMKNETDSYERFEYIYATDEEGNTVYDEKTGEPVIAVDENGNKLDNGGVPNGKYEVSTVVDINGTNTTIDTIINLYDDYGLESAFENAVLANRQQSDYNTVDNMGAATTLYTNYISVLKDVAKFVLKPKTASSFQTDIKASSSEYENKYEELSVALADAIEALEEYEVNAGVDGLKAALNKYSGANYMIIDEDYAGTDYEINPDGPYKVDIEYDDEAYVFFGMRDFVPHTYNRYKDARERVTDLIDSQEILVPAPLEDDATDAEVEAYAAALEAYATNLENMEVISSIDSLYAQHMLNLTGSRLIRIPANTSKLQIVYADFAGKVAVEDEGEYTVASLDRYRRAEAFAAEILEAGDANVYPSQVNHATTELVKAWKELAKGISYSQLDSAIAAAQEKIDEAGDPATQTMYTPESFEALYTAYENAVNVDRDLSDTESNNELLATLASAIYTAIDGLEEARAAEAIYELITDEMFMEPTGNYYFAPTVTMDKVGAYEHYSVEGDTVTGYIQGLGVYALYSEDEVIGLFGTLENCTVEVIPNPGVDEDNGGGYGTGAIARVVGDDGTVKDAYCLLVMGDINGDTIIDTTDASFIYQYEATMFEWEYVPEQVQYWMASDVNNDWSVDSTDAALIELAEAGITTYDMITGEQYDL